MELKLNQKVYLVNKETGKINEDVVIYLERDTLDGLNIFVKVTSAGKHGEGPKGYPVDLRGPISGFADWYITVNRDLADDQQFSIWIRNYNKRIDTAIRALEDAIDVFSVKDFATSAFSKEKVKQEIKNLRKLRIPDRTKDTIKEA